MVETLFRPGGTAFGEFIKTSKGAYFFDHQGNLLGCLVANGRPDDWPFFASATVVYDNGKKRIYHNYGKSLKAICGQELGYLDSCKLAERIWEDLKSIPAKTMRAVHTKAFNKATDIPELVEIL